MRNISEWLGDGYWLKTFSFLKSVRSTVSRLIFFLGDGMYLDLVVSLANQVDFCILSSKERLKKEGLERFRISRRLLIPEVNKIYLYLRSNKHNW